eukprot:GHVP01036727.1.p1 GENE.GHVP01036727.1~~GHVP01036727.1.p1  ORF type:complete len:319 (+),score=53.94 GHVP01036727.1:875-1831(+)
MSILKRSLQTLQEESKKIHGLLSKKNLSHPSILFTQEKAAEFDDETIFDIAQNGISELLDINDALFRPYTLSLFSSNSLYLNRENLTKKENKEIDSIIESFILSTEPYFLLLPFQQALEWLIRKYKIHFFSPDLMLVTYLRYHSTPKYRSIIKFHSNPSKIIRFMKGEKHKETIGRETIVTKICKSAILLEEIFKTLQRSIDSKHTEKLMSPLISFFTTLCIECSNRESINQVTVLSIYKLLHTSQKYEEYQELQIGCLMAFFSMAKHFSEDGILIYCKKASRHIKGAQSKEAFKLFLNRMFDMGYIKEVEYRNLKVE